MKESYDVVIVGTGNAAFSAAHAAAESARKVLMLEIAPREWAGGNSYFTVGAIRTTYDNLDDLRPIRRSGRSSSFSTASYSPGAAARLAKISSSLGTSGGGKACLLCVSPSSRNISHTLYITSPGLMTGTGRRSLR